MAIIDRREIEFDRESVRQVLEWSPHAAQAFGLPPLTPDVVRCKPVDGVIEVTFGKLTATHVFMLRAEALGAILIAYCDRAGLPMPRDADKAVRIEREHAVVVFTLRMAGAPLPEPPERLVNRVPKPVGACGLKWTSNVQAFLCASVPLWWIWPAAVKMFHHRGTEARSFKELT